MHQGEYDAFADVMNATAETYGRTLSHNALALYWSALQDITLDELRRAISAHVNNPDTGQFMPKPADVRRVIGGTTADAAAMAWAKVIRTVKSVGAYATVAFDDPFTHAAIADMGGWPTICHTAEEELPFREREFAAKYRAYRARGAEAISFPAKLTGLIDQHNVPRGHGAGDVALIGNSDRAARVMEHGKFRPWLQVAYVPGEGVKPAADPPRLGLLPVRRPGALSDADRQAMNDAEREIAARANAA